MKTLLFPFFLLTFSFSFCQTMTFDNGAAELGFTFSGWSDAGGTIWHENLANPAIVSKDIGTWNFISFEVGPFVGENMMEVTSDLGDVFAYETSNPAVHTLNWEGVTTITFTRISGSGAAADHDNFNYTLPAPCADPETPTLGYEPELVCKGDPVMININGNLNSATSWQVYSGACGETLEGSTVNSEIMLSPNAPNTTYFIRGEDGNGCVDETSIACANITIPVFEINATTTLSDITITANEAGAMYQWIDCENGNEPIEGANNQTFTPTGNGSYAVIITKNDCIDTSACVELIGVGTKEFNREEISVFPNPTNGIIHINLAQVFQKTAIKVLTLTGKEIKNFPDQFSENIILELDIQAGLYLLEISIEEQAKAVFKIIVL